MTIELSFAEKRVGHRDRYLLFANNGPVLVADVAALHPLEHLGPVEEAGKSLLGARVAAWLGNSRSLAGSAASSLAWCSTMNFELFVDGDGSLPLHLEVVRLFELYHDVLTERAGQRFSFLGPVLGEEHRSGRQVTGPTVLADRGEDQVQLPDHVPPHCACAAQFGLQMGQVQFQKGAGQPGSAREHLRHAGRYAGARAVDFYSYGLASRPALDRIPHALRQVTG